MIQIEMKDISTLNNKIRDAEILPYKTSLENEVSNTNRKTNLANLKKKNSEIMKKVMNFIENEKKQKKSNKVKYTFKSKTL